MKNLRKIIISFLCIAAACLVLGGCEKTSSQIENESREAIKAKNLEDVRTFTEEYFAEAMKQLSAAELESYTQQAQVVSIPFDNDWHYRWSQFEEKHGKVTDAVVDLVDKTDDGFTGRIILTGEDEGQMALTVTYDRSLRPISTTIADYSDDSKETLGSKMAVAGVNTVTGLLVVFSVLVLLSLIISAFKLLNKASEVAPEKKDARPAAPAPVSRAAAPAAAAAEEIDISKNQELVAVIAAAIAAAEDKPVEGYVVRSIRRLNNNKWR